MPGFNINGAVGPNHMTEVRRKHRWIFVTLGSDSVSDGLLWLKTANRPEIEVLPLEMHYDQERAWQAGKHQWSDLEIVWYDAEQNPDVSGNIYNWINEVVNLTNANAAEPIAYKKDGILDINRTGKSNGYSERWEFVNLWPTKVNWGNLDYTTSDIAEVTTTLKFDRVRRLPGPVINAAADLIKQASAAASRGGKEVTTKAKNAADKTVK